ncbi:MAG TPA: hypothetical protein VFU31_31615 [Candidatus Binatia bacterium]|nr:hypothetical protein [Candidatus Binatia bacterium]
MTIAEHIAWLLPILACASAFFFGYSVLEDLIKARRRKRHTPPHRVINTKPARPNTPAPVAPAIRGYDTPELFRQDSLRRIQKLQQEINALRQSK